MFWHKFTAFLFLRVSFFQRKAKNLLASDTKGVVRLRSCSSLREGFTLAELAIVILVLSLLLVVIFGVMNGIITVSTRTSPEREARRRAFFAMQVVKSSIEQAYYIANQKRIWFVGRNDGLEGSRRDRLTFAAVHPGAEDIAAPAVREVSYYLRQQNEEDGYTLIRREDEMIDDEPGKGGAHYELLRNVSSFKIRYRTNTKDWVDSWDSRNKQRLPIMVQIEILFLIKQKEQTLQSLALPGMNIK